MASALDSMAAAISSSWETITPRLMTSNPASVKAWYKMRLPTACTSAPMTPMTNTFFFVPWLSTQIMLLAGGYNGDGLGTGEYSVMQDYYVFTEGYYTLFFPAVKALRENIYSSSGKFHTVSWREPSRPSTWATAWLPWGTRLGTPVMASARAFRSWMSTTGEACLAQLTGQLRPLGFTAIPPLGYQHINAGPGVEIQVTRSVTMGSRARTRGARIMVSFAPAAASVCPPEPPMRQPLESVWTLTLKSVSISVAPRMTTSRLSTTAPRAPGPA